MADTPYGKIKARYDLRNLIASFDFYSWLVTVAAKGATDVVIGIKNAKATKWSEETTLTRIQNIILPGPALLGMGCEVGEGGDPFMGTPYFTDLIQSYIGGLVYPKLKTVLPPGKERYTITLRDERRIPERNSNVAAWRQFAREIGARVIEDYEVEPISLHERMALYAGAEMNFGVVNGPMHLILLADYPMMMFRCHTCAKTYVKSGIEYGGQYPWCGPDQMAIWEPDDLPTIRKHFDAWQRRKET